MDDITITIQHHGKPIQHTFSKDATLEDLSNAITELLNIPADRQKLYITPKIGLLKPPFSDPNNHPLATLTAHKITLMGSTAAETTALSDIIHRASTASARRSQFAAAPSKSRDVNRARDEAQYTFHTIRPLTYLPNPERSTALLERLAGDAGIKAAMRKWKFSVGLLTEMNPVEHTTRESKTLGLNRNAGEVIELRLRTDAYDGYRDYKTIRRTLCHELAHNVWSDHDGNFWKLCREIEKVVERDDWTRGGRSVGGERAYEFAEGEGEEHVDGGGWSGGEFVVGRGPGAGDTDGLTRREILARAAEERVRRLRRENDGDGGSGSGTNA